MKDLYILKLSNARRFHLFVYNWLMFLGMVFILIKGSYTDFYMVLFGIGLLFIIIYNSKYFLFHIKKIVVSENEVIFFLNILKEIKVKKTDIELIKVVFGEMLEIKLNVRSIHGFAQFEGFSNFIEDVKNANPMLKTEGI